MNKNIVVTGGAGFLGSHLCEVLVHDGNYVICVDNCMTGSKHNVEHLFSSGRFEFIRQDVQTPLEIEGRQIDEIYNLACPASPPAYQRKPIETMKTSVQGAINMLELAYKYGAKILQASTSEIYGEPLNHPQQEEDWGNVNPIGIRSCYDVGKRAAECLFNDYYRLYQIESKIVRIFNTYGPRMDQFDGRVVSTFIRQALLGEDITIFGDGTQTRSFCYRDDLIKGMIKVMDQVKYPQWPVNLGNPKEITIRGIAELVIEMTNSKSSIVYQDLPEDDPTRRRPNISRAKELGWDPCVDIREGLRKTIRYFETVGLYREHVPYAI
jgi:UDP-glucuronate decarboxylase